MARGAYFGSGYAGDYNREHVGGSVASAAEREEAAEIAGLLSGTSGYAEVGQLMSGMAYNNSALSQASADRAMEFSRESALQAQDFSAEEAKKTRDWQEQLANSAHQREVADLKAAGLNPILSANTGAFTGSGATGMGFSSAGQIAQTDMSAPSLMASLFMNQQNNANAIAQTGMYNDATVKAANAAAGAQMYQADKNSETNLLTTAYRAEVDQIMQDNSLTFQEKENRQERALKKYLGELGSSTDLQVVDKQVEAQKYLNEHNVIQNPVAYGNMVGDKMKDQLNSNGNRILDYVFSLFNKK